MITINAMTVYSFFVSFTDEFPSIAGSYCPRKGGVLKLISGDLTQQICVSLVICEASKTRCPVGPGKGYVKS